MLLQNFIRQNQKLLRATSVLLCEAHNHCHPRLGRAMAGPRGGAKGRGNGGAGEELRTLMGSLTRFCVSESRCCMH